MYTSIHRGFDQRAHVLVFYRTLATHLVEPSPIGSVPHGLILQITFASLVADGAVQRMICQQKLHDTFSSFVCKRRVRLNHHTRLYRPCTGGNRLRRSFNLNQAHATIPRNHKLLVVAISRYRDAGLLACLNESRSRYTARQFLSECRYTLAVPSIDTCLPSIVSCTSAGLLDVALKHLAPACHLVCLASRAADLDSCGRSMAGSSDSN